jgi:nickel/cobalt transporter (NiCoT) family protein
MPACVSVTRSSALPGADRRLWAMCAALGLANLAAWGWAWTVFAGNPVLLATALLAYTFGLRHAVDADHIAAIDNATRKLIETGRPAMTTGLYFSLGHATVVVLASLGIAAAAARLQGSLAPLLPWANALATGFSALCLFGLALANTVVLIAMVRVSAALRRSEAPAEAELQRLLAKRGLLGRLLRGVFGLIGRSWHMYLVGFLFGLGFDTATEIGVLALSAAEASHGLPLVAIMVFPALFAAGMALVDTLDAVLMAGAYRWASNEPARKVYYNLTVTATSVVIAAVIGAVELLGLYSNNLDAAGGVWRVVAVVNGNFAGLGTAIVAAFAATWLVAWLIWRTRAAPSR